MVWHLVLFPAFLAPTQDADRLLLKPQLCVYISPLGIILCFCSYKPQEDIKHIISIKVLRGVLCVTALESLLREWRVFWTELFCSTTCCVLAGTREFAEECLRCHPRPDDSRQERAGRFTKVPRDASRPPSSELQIQRQDIRLQIRKAPNQAPRSYPAPQAHHPQKT